MKMVCPACERKTDIEMVRKRDVASIRGEKIPYVDEYQRCTECGGEFENTRGFDTLEPVYREYRKRHGMLQPEDIRNFRKTYELTQKEFGDLLGFGGATLSRYENGALQSEAHEKLLRLAMEPRNLLSLIQKDSDTLLSERKLQLLKQLINADLESCSLDRLYEERFGNYSPDEFSGYKKLDLKKFYNMILFFCSAIQFKTKLNKLLFYADFKFFKEYTVSISGIRYAHLPYGPGPDKYEFYLANLIHTHRQLKIEEVIYPYCSGETYLSLKEPDLKLFDDKELSTLQQVESFFRDYSASAITDFSHREKGYTETTNGEQISYEFSRDLQL